MPLIWQRSSRFWARHKIPLCSNSPHFRRARFYIRPTKRLPWRGSFPQHREMSRSDKGDRPRKRFRHTVGRGSLTFSFNLCTQKTAAFPRQSKKIALAPAPSLCFRRRRRSPPQQAILVPNGVQTAVPSKTYNKKYPAASCEVFCGAPSGTRTQDPLIKSQLLYQLS